MTNYHTIQLPKKEIKLRTSGQKIYVDQVRKFDLTFCTGPAGTGKTFLAVACALEALKKDRIQKIILCRPAVEAGEKLGHLPGELWQKLEPFLCPLTDALRVCLSIEEIRSMEANESLESVGLGLIRGRTFNNAFIVLDEAQNTTPTQMKMFLTRMGTGSKIVVVGDESQVDLKGENGLADAKRRFFNSHRISFVSLTADDIQRHPLLQEIIEGYEPNYDFHFSGEGRISRTDLKNMVENA